MSTASSAYITVATANTHWSHLLATDDGLKPLADTDILLLQEVVVAEEDGLEDHLRQAGFELIYVKNIFGLAIALRRSSKVAFVSGSIKMRRLQKMKPFERYAAQRWAKRSHHFTERGTLAAKFVTQGGQVVTVVNAHLSAPIQPWSRAAQVRLIGQELNDPYYGYSLIVAGDMNHYRGPTAIDKRMYRSTNLQRVDLNGEPTWYVHGSTQERYFKIGSFFTRQPMEHYNGYHDAMLYRGEGLESTSVRVVDVQSDHRAIVARFALSHPKIRATYRTTPVRLRHSSNNPSPNLVA